jgi:hypothetical protein
MKTEEKGRKKREDRPDEGKHELTFHLYVHVVAGVLPGHVKISFR